MILTDREHFLEAIADQTKVRKIARSKPYYSLNIGLGLILVYEVFGKTIKVTDIMTQALLDNYGAGANTPSPQKENPQPV